MSHVLAVLGVACVCVLLGLAQRWAGREALRPCGGEAADCAHCSAREAGCQEPRA